MVTNPGPHFAILMSAVLPFGFLLQGCGAPPSGGGGGGTASRPSVPGSSVSSPIEPGIYIGELVCDTTFTSPEGTVEDMDQGNTSVTFGESGLPIDDNGQEIREGSRMSFSAGGLSMDSTVKDVTISVDGVVVSNDVTMTVDDPSGPPLVFTGTVQEVYRLSGSGIITNLSQVNLGHTGASGVFFFDIDCRAELGGSVQGDDQDGDGGLSPADDSVPDTPVEGDVESLLSTREVLEASWQILGGEIIASAFAVDSNLLATNAHVVVGISETSGGEYPLGVAVQHETGEIVSITRMWLHPDYNGDSGTSPDVGVIEVDGTLPTVLQLADVDALMALEVFDEVRLCSFPADVTAAIDLPNLEFSDDFRPRATCLTGQISALRAFDSTVAVTPQNSQLIQHDIASTRGTSGSPVYTLDAGVIGVNAASTFDEAGLNRFAIRIDALRGLLDMIAAGSVEPVSPPDSSPEDTQPPSPDAVTYPRVITDPAPGCDLICIQYMPETDVFCDSDCDGWFDNVEVEFFYDRCNPFDPPYRPTTPSSVCNEVLLYLKTAPQLLAESAIANREEQRLELELRAD